MKKFFPFSWPKIPRILPRPELFFVLKFGGKIYLRMTESELRVAVAQSGGVGVQFKDKSLVFQCYEIGPEKKKAPGV